MSAQSFYDAYRALVKIQSEAYQSQIEEINAFTKKTGHQNVRVINPERMMNLILPSCMCISFSLELHLKMFYFLKYKEKLPSGRNGHDISKIIEKFPPSDIQQLRSGQEHPHFRSDDFFKNIEIISKNFEEVRYPYERNEQIRLDPEFCVALIKAIQREIKMIKPDLQWHLDWIKEGESIYTPAL